MSFNIPKVSLKCQELLYQKIKSIDTKLFGKAIDIQSLHNIGDFEELVSKFSGNLKSTLDAMAPLKTKVVTQYPPKAWFNDGITKQKQVVRNREHVLRSTTQIQPGWTLMQKGISCITLYIWPRKITFLI